MYKTKACILYVTLHWGGILVHVIECDLNYAITVTTDPIILSICKAQIRKIINILRRKRKNTILIKEEWIT